MNDSGIASVMLMVTAAVTALGLVVVVVIGVLLASHAQVQRAADLVALAAAPLSEEPPCAVAEEIARLNDVTLMACHWADGMVDVTVTRPSGLVALPKLMASASAEATIPAN